MDQTRKDLLDGLRQAMQAERTGCEFYKNAARTTEDPVARDLFAQLAVEEQEHFDFLAAHYRALLEGDALADVKLDHTKISDESPIFSPQLKARIKEAHFEMSALAIAAQLELSGIRHYRAQAEKATRPDVRRFFEDLAAWETVHYNAFLRQQQELQDRYWDEAGFAPF